MGESIMTEDLPLSLEVSPNGVLDVIEEFETNIFNFYKNDFKQNMFS